MRDDVEDRGDECANAARKKHVAELRDGRVGENFLDVVLRETDRRRKQRCSCADDGHDEHCGRRVHEDLRAAHDHVNAGRYHGGRVNQSGDGRRTGHRVGQPNVEWNLRALSRRADEKQHGD